MANLDYLKVGNYIKRSVVGRYTGKKEDNLIKISELKINKKTVLINGRKYQINGNKLYNEDSIFVTVLSEIDKQFEDNIKNELNAELSKLEDTVSYLSGLVDNAKSAENIVAIDHLNSAIKEVNKKIKL